MRYLLDTNVIIYYLNDDPTAVAFIEEHRHQSAISRITYLEVLVFPYDEEEDRKVRNFLELFAILEIERNVIEQAIETYRNKKVKIADNLIGSTAKWHDLTLVTRNVRDFDGMEIDVLDPYRRSGTVLV